MIEASIYAYEILRLDHLGSCGKWCSGDIETENDNNRPVNMLARASKAAIHCILASTIRLPFLRRGRWVVMVKNSSLRDFQPDQGCRAAKVLVGRSNINTRQAPEWYRSLGDDHSDRRTMDLRGCSGDGIELQSMVWDTTTYMWRLGLNRQFRS